MMIEVKNLTKTFGDFKALDQVNMHIKKGSVYGLVGPNGAGKTTLIRHICGIFRPDEGEVFMDEQPLYENPEVKSRLAYIPDELFYFPQSTILDLKNYYKGIYPSFDEELFEKLKEIFAGLDPKKQMRRLSKGMQKQAVFWISICCKPEFLVLDEPMDGLDPVMRHQVWNIVLNQVAEHGLTVLVSSHNLRELEDVCDHVGIMFDGQIILERSLSDLQGDIAKVQAAYPDGLPEFTTDLQILHQSHVGRVYTLIVRGEREEIIKAMERSHPLLLDVLPLTLEEIFIYEMGGVAYEIKDILA